MQTPWITFDCFGTLIDWNVGFAKILRPMFGKRTEELIIAYHEFERSIQTEKPHRLYKDVLASSLRSAAQDLNLELTESQAQGFIEAWDSMPLFQDTEEMLASLRAMGFKLAVLTNCDEDLFALTHRRFHQPFDLVVTAESVRDYKPASAHFRAFWRSSGVDRRNWIHVGCSWYHDIFPAREFGIQRIWLDRESTGENESIASVHVHSAKAACAAIERLQNESYLSQLVLPGVRQYAWYKNAV
ncbi:MAG: family hydrolase [Verrucomicrobiales bacterium]|nr:family hydrolase [Verrucomicrobiales bacterium]